MNTLILTLFMTYNHTGAVPHNELTKRVMMEAEAAHVSPVLVAKIIIVESGGLADAYNAASRDYGLMQINEKTANYMHISPECLQDWKCNLHYGVLILAKMLKHKRGRPCMYNLGTAGALKRENDKICLTYEQKLYSIN